MKLVALFLFAAVASTHADAQTFVYDQPMTPGGGTLRASQLWIDPSGQNDSDTDAIAWEDFQLTQDTVVTRVRWSGQVAPALGFSISFFHQDPNTIAVQPDMFAAGSAPISEELHTTFSQVPVGAGLYQFEADLHTPLLFLANTRYFVSVVGQSPISYATWGWAQSSSGTNGTFWWMRGAHMYFHVGDNRAVSLASDFDSSVGTTFCFGNGVNAPCPCGNRAANIAGCANSTDLGAAMTASGSASVSADDLVLTTIGVPANQNGLDFLSATTTPPAPFGDGLRCVSGQMSRMGLRNSGPDGIISYGPGLAAVAASSFPPTNQFLAGNVLSFQTWYRDAQGPCNGNTNLSSALSVAFVP